MNLGVLGLLVDWNYCNSENVTFQVFLSTYSFNTFLYLILSLYYYRSLVEEKRFNSDQGFVARLIYGLHQTADFFDFMLVIFGYYLVTSSPRYRTSLINLFNDPSFILSDVTYFIAYVRLFSWIAPIFIFIMIFLFYLAFYIGKEKRTIVEVPDPEIVTVPTTLV